MLASASMDLERLIKHGNHLLRPTLGHKSERISPGLSPAVRRSPSPALHDAVGSAQEVSPEIRNAPLCSSVRRPPMSGMGSGAGHIAPACWKITPGAVHIDVRCCPDHSRVQSRSLSGSDLINLLIFPRILERRAQSPSIARLPAVSGLLRTNHFQIRGIRKIRGFNSSESEAALSS